MVTPSSSTGLEIFKEGFVIGDRYRVDGVLATGELSILLRARHIQLDDRVIVKVLSDRVDDVRVAARFVREARNGARVKSDHVARFLDVGTLEDGRPFVVMENLDGEDLEQLLKSGQPIALTDAASIIVEMCDGLAAAHAVGIVHRDLQPSSIFLARTPMGRYRVKLMNFGTGRVFGSDGHQEDPGLTVAGLGLTRLDYMAPELFLRSAVDGRADIWSLGVVLFEMLTGTRPFVGGPSEMTRQLLVEPPPAPSTRCPDLPPEIDALVLRCLEKRPEDRFDDVGQVAAALAPFASPSLGVLASALSARAANAIELEPISLSDPADKEDEGSVYRRLPGGQFQKTTYDRLHADKVVGDGATGRSNRSWPTVIVVAAAAAVGLFFASRQLLLPPARPATSASPVPSGAVSVPGAASTTPHAETTPSSRGAMSDEGEPGPVVAPVADTRPRPPAAPRRRLLPEPSSRAATPAVAAPSARGEDPWGWKR